MENVYKNHIGDDENDNDTTWKRMWVVGGWMYTYCHQLRVNDWFCAMASERGLHPWWCSHNQFPLLYPSLTLFQLKSNRRVTLHKILRSQQCFNQLLEAREFSRCLCLSLLTMTLMKMQQNAFILISMKVVERLKQQEKDWFLIRS